MKRKYVKVAVKNKIADWLKSLPDGMREQVCDKVVVTGGAIASLLLGEDVNDYDIYFRDRETTLLVAKYYIEQFKANPPPKFKESTQQVEISIYEKDLDRVKIVVKSAGIAGEEEQDDYRYFESDLNPDATDAHEYVEKAAGVVKDAQDEEKPKYRPVFLSSNAITLSHKIQIVTRFFGDPVQIHENYDFVHCTGYYCSWTDTLDVSAQALESLLTKELRYNGSRYPICSIIRIRKFLKRGWTINAGQIVKMAWQISHLNLEDIKVLEDQLTGVDQAYFNEVINLLRSQAKGGKDIDSAYLMEVIDKIF